MPPARPGETWVRSTLRIFSDELTPRALARALEAVPNAVYERVDGEGRQLAGGGPRTTWMRELASAEPDGLAVLLGSHADFLEQRAASLAELREQITVDLYCGLYTRSRGAFVLPALLLWRLGALATPVVLDLYPPGSERFSSEAPLESPDWRWSRAVLLEGRRLLRESRFASEAPLEKHVGELLVFEAQLAKAPRRMLARFTSASGHGLAVLSSELLAGFVERDVTVTIELVPPPFEAPPAET
jgi:hypothetical protein